LSNPTIKRIDAALEKPDTPQRRELLQDALLEISRLEGLLQSKGIPSGSEYICRCGLRREAPKDDKEIPF
jgi:hypothetical protein